MKESTTRQKDDQCQDTTDKEKKKKKSCLVAANPPTAAMSSVAPFNITVDNLAAASTAATPNDNEADKQDNTNTPAAAPAAATAADNTNEIEVDDDIPPPVAAAANEADDDTPPAADGAPSVTVSKAHVGTVATKKIGASQKTIAKFVELPSSNKYCVKVDTDKGMWAQCKCGTKVKTRDGRPFDTSRFKDHCTPHHNAKVDGGDKAWAKGVLDAQKAGKKVHKLDQANAKSILTKQKPLPALFFMVQVLKVASKFMLN